MKSKIATANNASTNFLNYPSLTLIITTLLAMLFIYLQMNVYNNDITRFIVAGDMFVNKDKIPCPISVIPSSAGYDGQFYYRFSLKPFTGRQTDLGIKIDSPAYRQQRILYPLVVFLLSLGYKPFVPYLMVLINFLSLCFIGWIGGKLSIDSGKHAIFGLIFPLYAGFVVTLDRNLTELFSTALIIAAIYYSRKSQPIATVILLTLSVFARETTLIVPWSMFIAFIICKLFKKETKIRLFYFVVPSISYFLLKVALFFNWHTIAPHDISDKFGVPLAAFIRLFILNSPFSDGYNYICFYEQLFWFLFVFGVLFSIKKSTALLEEKIAWVHYFIIATLLTQTIYVDGTGFFRALTEFFWIGNLILLCSKARIRFPIFFVHVFICIHVAILVIYYPSTPQATLVQDYYKSKESTVIEAKNESNKPVEKIRFTLKSNPTRNHFRAGESIELLLDVKSNQSYKADLYFVLYQADRGKAFFAPRWSQKPMPVARNLNIKSVTDIRDVSLFKLQFPQAKSPCPYAGKYIMAIGAAQPKTMNFISNIATFELTIEK